MVKAFTTMALEMWKHRCGCMHGHTVAEKKALRKEEIGSCVRKCYKQRGRILLEHQDIFHIPVETLISERSSQYLTAWTLMFRALVTYSEREVLEGRRLIHSAVPDDDSMASVDMMDLDEYLVDVTEGMDREWDIGNWQDWKGEEDSNIFSQDVHGDIKLLKRKPPDGNK